MIIKQNKGPAEQISHRTSLRPFSIHRTIVTPGTEPALYLHYHTELELLYMEAGELCIYIEDTPYNLKTGDAIFIPPNMLHYAIQTSSSELPCSFRALVFDHSMIMDTAPSYCMQYITPTLYNGINCVLHISVSSEWGNNIIQYLQQIFLIDNNSDITSYELELRGKIMLIWQIMYNNHFSFIQKKHVQDHMFSRLSKCIDYINNNSYNNISLDELAGMCGLSEGHFCRTFKDFTGFTPFTYINRIRILDSCRLLTESDLSIADIATKCGYNNISYYNRTFRKIMHLTPSEYRHSDQYIT